jgi:hypothetical protein
MVKLDPQPLARCRSDDDDPFADGRGDAVDALGLRRRAVNQ